MKYDSGNDDSGKDKDS